MNSLRVFLNPIFVFGISLAALVTSFFIYISWYLKISKHVRKIVEKFHLDPAQFLEYETWVMIVTLSVLPGLILLGMFVIFVYYQKMIELYRLQQNFINGFTHELKTPVASLRLFLDTFIKHDLPRQDQLKYLKFMINDTERLSKNINRILNLSKIEDKDHVTEFVYKDLEKFIEDFIKQQISSSKDCEFNFKAISKGPFVYPVNVQLFEILLTNLISNACKYNDSDKSRIDITIRKSKKYIVIKIKDNGIGIHWLELKNIFKKFYQIGTVEDMTARGKGGLGLYIVKNIVRIHGGKIEAQSMGKGSGSTFLIILPIKNTNNHLSPRGHTHE